jgi:uncharacterized membrane protein YhhN
MIFNNLIIISFIIFFIILLTIKIISILTQKLFFNYLSTPLIILYVITFSLYSLYNNPDIYKFFIIIGFIFSLTGDVFNLFEKPDNSHLLYSIFFFFFTHLSYSIAFLTGYTFAIYHIFILTAFIILNILLYKIFKININNNTMKIGILLYMMLITLTLLIALGNLNTKISNKSLFISIGMFIFWLSDLIIGIDAYIKKIKYSTSIIWILYAPAQLLIALSTYY